MALVFVGIGLSMLALASGLAGIGHYDGVLGADDPEALLNAEDPTTFRVVVIGTVAEAQDVFALYEKQLVLPENMREHIETRRFIPVQIEGLDKDTEAFLEIADPGFVPQRGLTLVVSGTVTTEWALFDAGRTALESMPVLFIRPESYHEPLLFKA
jgi:hypothetical protein